MADTLEYLLKLSNEFSGPARKALADVKSLGAGLNSAGTASSSLESRIARLKGTISSFQQGSISAAQAARQLGAASSQASSAAASAGSAISGAATGGVRGLGLLAGSSGIAATAVWAVHRAAERLSKAEFISAAQRNNISNITSMFKILSNGIDSLIAGPLALLGGALNRLTGGKILEFKQDAAARATLAGAEAQLERIRELTDRNIEIGMSPEQKLERARRKESEAISSIRSAEAAAGTNRTPDERARLLDFRLAKEQDRLEAVGEIKRLEREIAEERERSSKNAAEDAARDSKDAAQRRDSILDKRKDLQANIQAGEAELAGDEAGADTIRNRRRAEREAGGLGLTVQQAFDAFEKESAIERQKKQAEDDQQHTQRSAEKRARMLENQKDLQAEIQALEKSSKGDDAGAQSIRNRRRAEKEAADFGVPIDDLFAAFEKESALEREGAAGRKNTFNEHAARYGRTALDGVRQKIKGYSFEKQAPKKETFDEFFHKKPRSFLSPEDIKFGKPSGVEPPGQLSRRERRKEAEALAAKQDKPRWDLVQSIEKTLTNIAVA